MASLIARRPRRYLVDPSEPSAEPFRTLRLALDIRQDGRSGNVLVCTSPLAGEGKTLVATNYALVAAQSCSVLLIDGDLRRPAVHERFGIDRSPGLVELLAAGSDIRRFARPAVEGTPGLEVIPAGREIPSPGDLISSRRMADVLRQASEAYDLVVVDSPPLLSTLDAASLGALGGTDVLVVVDSGSRRRTLLRALRQLRLMETNVAGIVLNRDGELSPYTY